MATTTAIVTADGLSLPPEVMDRLALTPASKVTVVIEAEQPKRDHPDVIRLIKEARGMFAGNPNLEDELMQWRREENDRSAW